MPYLFRGWPDWAACPPPSAAASVSPPPPPSPACAPWWRPAPGPHLPLRWLPSPTPAGHTHVRYPHTRDWGVLRISYHHSKLIQASPLESWLTLGLSNCDEVELRVCWGCHNQNSLFTSKNRVISGCTTKILMYLWLLPLRLETVVCIGLILPRIFSYFGFLPTRILSISGFTLRFLCIWGYLDLG